jgi:DNA polymerase-1
MIDLLALMGDKVDNIPGVAGVGEKTALGLLQGLGGLDEIYASLDRVKDLDFRGAKTMAAKLEKERDAAYLSYRLATIATDVELPLHHDDLVNGEADRDALLALYRELEFKTWIDEVERGEDAETGGAIPEAGARREYDTILDEDAFRNWLDRLAAAELFAFDTETTSLDYMQAELVGVSFAVEPGASPPTCPSAHAYPVRRSSSIATRCWPSCKPLLEDERQAPRSARTSSTT